MPKKKIAKFDLGSFVGKLEEEDRAVQQYKDALSNLDLSSHAVRLLSPNEQFGLAVSKFGFEEVSRVVRAIEVSSISTLYDPCILASTLEVDVKLIKLLLGQLRSTASDHTTTSASSATGPNFFLVPPYSTCLECGLELKPHNQPVKVKVVTLQGCFKGLKSNLRCRNCSLTYRYDCYGSSSRSFHLYEKVQPFIEASNVVYFQRDLFELQVSLANHSWVSFVGFAESFNTAFGLSRSEGISSKQVSSAFFHGELHNELRERRRLDMFGLLKTDGDREKLLERIESIRRQTIYDHTNCHPKCEAKGCGRVFVADGIWKLSFPHCMHRCENKVSGIPVPSLPDVCTKSPLYGQAFCTEHCEVAKQSSIPTGLADFLKYCGVKGDDAHTDSTGLSAADIGGPTPLRDSEGPSTSTTREGRSAVTASEGRSISTANEGPSTSTASEGLTMLTACDGASTLTASEDPSTPLDNTAANLVLACDANCNQETITKVGGVLSKLQPVSCCGESVVDAQGTTAFLNEHSYSISTMLNECVEEIPSTCKKDVGGKKRLQKWSRGHLFVVRAGGHIEFWKTLYKSESPSQVFLILIAWLFPFLRTVPFTSWSNLSIVYDNMCHLDNMNVARKPLPLAWPWSHMWLNLHKCVDRLHVRNHTDKLCRTKYNPDDHLLETDNTLCAEQTFVWLSRYKKILCAMPKLHHLFYLHRMVVRRNKYTEYCYNSGYDPLLPVVKSTSTT
ncbi:uncharacterized protein LOC110985613 [Acanthaster planci]|uniref:Uncharacterized protein LOC110985613 n=1 Tax=Acanthaster planci TaxID=133434 RepID=A0A8B7Z9Z1_ACAPL|nr:uncharacterized protein LOC110985613 [Acanthaster planci]